MPQSGHNHAAISLHQARPLGNAYLLAALLSTAHLCNLADLAELSLPNKEGGGSARHDPVIHP